MSVKINEDAQSVPLPTIHTVTEVKSCLLGEEVSKFNSVKGVAMETRESVQRRLGWSRGLSGWQRSSSFLSPLMLPSISTWKSGH